jgi:serine/threonine protein kinase
MPDPCPPTDLLEAVLRGQAGAAESGVTAHLADCAGCQRRLEELAGGSGWLLAKAASRERATRPATAALEQAMRRLEARPAAPEDEPASPARLDFLEPSDRPGGLGRFGPYEVLEHVASGGMGIVLKARDPVLNRVVAIKVLPPPLAARALARARFIREARAAAAVAHEHVVAIHAVDEWAGLPYLVMPFVNGRSLADRLRATGPLRLEEILRIGAQTAAGLAAAHAQGLVHRDVKPGNILLENSVERVKLTDFGLARAADDAALTVTGQLAGTPEYMSPEQARGGEQDARSDLFSLGAVLYAMASGVSPFHAPTAVAAIRRVCDEAPAPLRVAAPGLPGWLGDFVHTLLAKNPADRVQTASEVAAFLEDALQRLQRGLPGPERKSPPRTALGEARRRRDRRTLRWLAVGSVGAVLVALGLQVAFRGSQQPGRPPPGNNPTSPPSPVYVVLAGDGALRTPFPIPDLEQAIAAAHAGDTIELRTDGRMAFAPVTIHDKPLRIRAGAGVRPVLVHAPGSRPLILSDAALVLEGLTFELSPLDYERRGLNSRGPPALQGHADIMNNVGGITRVPLTNVQAIVTMQQAPLLATHCRFVVRDLAVTLPGTTLAALRLAGSRHCGLRHCEVQSLHANGVEWDEAGSPRASTLVLSNCVHLGRTALSLVPSGEAETTVSLERCTIASFTLVHSLVVGTQPVRIRVQRTVADVAALLAMPPWARRTTPLPGPWRWEGQDNVYSVATTFMAQYPRERWAGPTNLPAWRDFWQSAELGCLEARVAFDLPLASGSQTNFAAAQMQFRPASGETNPLPAAVGAVVSAVGPGPPYADWKRTAEAAEWERTVAAFLSASR